MQVMELTYGLSGSRIKMFIRATDAMMREAKRRYYTQALMNNYTYPEICFEWERLSVNSSSRLNDIVNSIGE